MPERLPELEVGDSVNVVVTAASADLERRVPVAKRNDFFEKHPA
jgi:hypothetical protein